MVTFGSQSEKKVRSGGTKKLRQHLVTLLYETRKLTNLESNLTPATE